MGDDFSKSFVRKIHIKSLMISSTKWHVPSKYQIMPIHIAHSILSLSLQQNKLLMLCQVL